MSIATGVNITNITIKWATTDADIYDRATQLAGVAEALDLHDHSSGKGLPVTRLGTLTTGAEFSGTGLKITGDFSNATGTSRLMLQSSTTNGQTLVGAIPNGSSTSTSFFAYAATDPDQAAFLRLAHTGTSAIIDSNKNGGGTAVDLVVRAAAGTSSITFGATSALLTCVGTLLTTASASGAAGLRLPHGAAPSSPVNGDIWTTTGGLFVRINGVTVGPLS